jgi:hypothetical protein
MNALEGTGSTSIPKNPTAFPRMRQFIIISTSDSYLLHQPPKTKHQTQAEFAFSANSARYIEEIEP